MDYKEKTSSFIPKKSFAITNRQMESSIGLVSVVSFVILGVALVFFAGAYGYRYYLMDQINRPCGSEQSCGLRESLAREKAELNFDKISRFASLDAKMKAARGVIGEHIDLIPLFNFLELSTLHNVRFTSLEFTRGKGLKLSGQARNYEDIAIQHRVFKSGGLVTGSSFSNFKVDEDQNIGFDLNMSIDESILKYKLDNN